VKSYALALVAVLSAATLTACGSSAPSPQSSASGSVTAGEAFPALQVAADGTPTGFTWNGVAQPSGTGTTEVKVVKEGAGAVVKDTDTVSVNYLGELYQGTSPFDESYSGGQPVSFPLNGVVAGFKNGIAGQKIGSRILIKIPPAEGYGPDGNPPVIPGGATLYFVVDVISVG
jgi:peptidylprolyl isomerase